MLACMVQGGKNLNQYLANEQPNSFTIFYLSELSVCLMAVTLQKFSPSLEQQFSDQ